MATQDELWVEAERLEEPFFSVSIASIDGAGWVRGWARQYGIAALTLASFSDWDARALRAASVADCRPGGEQPLCGQNLLVMAALLTEQPPTERLRRIAH